ncbi:MAG: hypothetical protein JWP68_416 [Modestobacter sp.]|nr:hypothetical protein [Modestobacter sp.]
MNREEPALLRGPGRILAQRASRYWWALLIVGVAWLVIGWVVLRADVTSLATVGVLLGVVFIASGVNEAALASMVTGGWKVLHYGIAFLFLLAGLWSFIRPIDTFFALASVLGLILVFAGAFEITRGVATRGETPYWWTGLLSGVILLLLAAWVSVSDPQASIARRTYLILFWVGFMALLRGFTQIMMGFSLRHLGTEAASRAPSVTGADEAPPMVPAQERRAMGQPDSAQQTVPRV